VTGLPLALLASTLLWLLVAFAAYGLYKVLT
jgi:hypothetical protein